MKSESFSRGFDRGNYGSAYESQDWHAWYAMQCAAIPETEDRDAYEAGMLLGFFSSFEIHEISDETIADTVANLRKQYEDHEG